MRKVIEPQMQIGEISIMNIKLDFHSRDEIPKVLFGLQQIYSVPDVRKQVFNILEEIIPEGIDKNNGRKGMDLWKILVLGVVRLSCNWDYDKLKEIADQHKTIREMLGHPFYDNTHYPLQTIKDNISLFTPDVLDKINQIVVKSGYKALGKDEEKIVKGRVDSFVVETDVHYPTDINLLYDAIRKVITLIAALSMTFGINDWRKWKDNLLKIKRLFNHVRKLKHSTSKNEKKKKEKANEIRKAHQLYINFVKSFIEKAKKTIDALKNISGVKESELNEIEKYIEHAERQMEQIERRVVNGEKIPHEEKVFSVFEEHTEWINKGKAGVPQELGKRVCVVEGKHGFILHHQVIDKETDEKVAVSIINETKERFESFSIASFDKGFYTPDNRKKLSEILDTVVLPKKGKLSVEDQEIETSEEFINLKREHPGVESAINALENHGLDRCPDHGIKGFKRYVGLSVLAINLQIPGHIIQQKELKTQKRKERYRKTYFENKAAA